MEVVGKEGTGERAVGMGEVEKVVEEVGMEGAEVVGEMVVEEKVRVAVMGEVELELSHTCGTSRCTQGLTDTIRSEGNGACENV